MGSGTPAEATDRRVRAPWILFALVEIATLSALVVLAVGRRPPPAPLESVAVRPTATLLSSVRDLARLETTELHMEKVVDLADKQSRFFGLVQGTDAILLVAAGDVTLGVDLGKVTEDDIASDGPDGGAMRIALPAPEILSVRLDEDRTYVYTRATSLLARRNEHLEERARKEAILSLERAAQESNAVERAKRQAERQLGALLGRLSERPVQIAWR